jgi:hypothetical protein
MSQLNAAIGQIYAWEGNFPAYTDVEALRQSPTRAARWQIVRGWPYFAEMAEQGDIFSSLRLYREQREQELQEAVSAGTFLGDYLWLQQNLPQMRRLLRSEPAAYRDSDALLSALESLGEESARFQQQLDAQWETIQAGQDTVFALEVALDRFYLSVLLTHYDHVSPALRAYLDLLVENYNWLSLARLTNLGLEQNIHEILLESPGANLDDLEQATSFDLVLDHFRAGFDEFGLAGTSIQDVETLMRLREVRFVNGALFDPQPELITLGYMRRLFYLFYDLNVVLLPKNADTGDGHLLVNYDLLT